MASVSAHDAVGDSGDTGSAGDRMLARILETGHYADPGQVPSLVAESAAEAGIRDVVIYLTDYEQVRLVPLSGPGTAGLEPLAIDQTVAGRAYRTVETMTIDEPDGVRVWQPMLNGTHRVGVLGARVDLFDSETAHRCRTLGALVADLLVTKSSYTDLYHMARRSRPMTLAAEMQWNLLPPLTFSDGRVTISGVLEPSYRIAGDTFDYAVDDGIVHVAIIDAMGHGPEASIMAAVMLNAYRHSRRHGKGLAETYDVMSRTLSQHLHGDGFATGHLLQLDVAAGTVTWINAGHPEPRLIRGTSIISSVSCNPSLPLGLDGTVEEVAEFRMEPGDRLVLISDGVLEARSSTGQYFGEGPLEDFVTRAVASGLPVPEILRRLTRSVLDHVDERLCDDATTVLLEWHGRDSTNQQGVPGSPRTTPDVPEPLP